MFVVGLIALLLGGCSKDETKLIARPGAPVALQASVTSVVLTKENADETAISFDWEPADFGYKAAITNTLQIGLKGQDFVGAKEVVLDAGSKRLDYTTLAFNALLLAMELPVEEVTNVEVRIKSSISPDVAPLFSNAVQLAVTPYASISYLYVPGAYQSWVVETAESLVSPTSNGVYTGIIYFSEADSEFKITLLRNWDNSYGDAGDGKIALNDGGNIKSPKAGNLELTVNTNSNTISYKDHSWGLIGDATAGGWDADTDMRYDNATQLWKVTATLTLGNLKFRKNKDWGTNYGGANGILSAGGSDIPITQAGTYDIVLDILGNTYTMTKK